MSSISAAGPRTNPKARDVRCESAALNDPGEPSGAVAPISGDREEVTTLQVDANLPGGVRAATLRKWLERLVRELAPDSTSLTLRLAGAAQVQALNERYRRLARPTDVLSFPGGETPEGRHLGDIVIAVPIAQRQAREAGHDLLRELRILALHGVLHCLGYDHESDGGEMERIEADLRQRWVDLDD